jgi:gliding motility-associated-like protein
MKLVLLLILLFYILPKFSLAQHSFVLGDSTINEYSNSICADNNGSIYIGAIKNDRSVIVKYKEDAVMWSIDLNFSKTSDFGSIDVIGDTIFGCGWLKNGNTILGSTYFKMNAKTGNVYWKYEESTSKIYFSSMRYANGVYYLVGSEINGGLNYDGKVIAINSTTGNLIWQTPVMGLTFPTFNNDYIDDFVSSTNMINGKMFITGRTYCNGAPEVMRPTLIGVNDKGSVFLTKYISFDTQIDYTNRYYGVKIEYDGQDSLVLFQHGDDKATSTDYKTCISKMDTTGKVSWTKEYDIQGYSTEIVRSCNITPTEYVIFGSVEVLSGNPKVFSMKFTKNGNFIKGNLMSYKTSKISVTNGPIFVGGNSSYINNHHYFVASTYKTSTTQKDIIALVLDDNLSESHTCFSFSNIQVITKSYIPFSGLLNRNDKNLNVSYLKNTLNASQIRVGSPCDKPITFSSNSLNCSDNKIIASVTGVTDTNFVWSNGKTGKTIFVTNTDTLFVSIYDPTNCCTIKDTVVPIIKNTTGLVVTLNDTVVCQNATITLKPTVKSSNGLNPIITYKWNDGSNLATLKVNNEGLYYCDFFDGCSSVRDSAYVGIINKPEIAIQDTTLFFCSNITPFTVSPVLNNYTNYSWSDGTLTIDNTISSPGDYYISASNICGTTKKGIHVTLIPKLIHTPFINDTNGCVPFEFTLKDPILNPLVKQYVEEGNNQITSFVSNYTYKFNKAGVYTLKYFTINQGCVDTITYTISVFDLPVADFTLDKYLVEQPNNTILTFNKSTNANSYVWNFGDGSGVSKEVNPIHSYQNISGSLDVMLIAKNSNNCSDTMLQRVRILEELIFYVPNTFTPDGNEFNNVFNPVFYSGYDPYHYTMLIFDRWGEVIFESHNVKIGWDGTYHDKICPDGTYVWKIKFNDANYGDGHEFVGHVNLIKK